MTDSGPVPPVAPPGSGLDPTLALALGISAAPGTYALLAGSGISRAAQIPTGWEVVVDLIVKVAALQSDEAAQDAREDPEGWWIARGHGEPRYDVLLENLASTVAARRVLLHRYFEPTPDERANGIKQPTAAHRAIADLVSTGRIRLILTTNFDRLFEIALAETGVHPQVIVRSEAITAMAPLQHARATVIKLHGDYLDVDAMRNTPAELAIYDPAMKALLSRILDEYGLIILGWSGEWDTALVHAIESSPSRRYPTYWAAYHGNLSASARRLLSNRAGHLISIESADAFCTSLRDKVNVLGRMADPPPTRAVAVTLLKRNLVPDRRIDLFDQLNTATNDTIVRLTDQRYPFSLPLPVNDAQVVTELDRQLADYDADTDVLAALAAAATFHGTHETDPLILRAVRRLAGRPRISSGFSLDVLNGVRRYPALRLVTFVGVAAVAAGRESLLVPLLIQTTTSTMENSIGDFPLVQALHPWRVFQSLTALAQIPRLAIGGHLRSPHSRYLRLSCREALADVTDDDEYVRAFDRYEYLRSLLEIHYSPKGGPVAALGEFTGAIPEADEIDDTWPLVAAGGFDGDPSKARQAHTTLAVQVSSTPLV